MSGPRSKRNYSVATWTCQNLDVLARWAATGGQSLGGKWDVGSGNWGMMTLVVPDPVSQGTSFLSPYLPTSSSSFPAFGVELCLRELTVTRGGTIRHGVPCL